MSTDSKVQELGDRATRMFNEARAKLDIAGYVFRDGTGEAWCRQLRDLAQECTAARMSFAARNLEATAAEIEERSEDW